MSRHHLANDLETADMPVDGKALNTPQGWALAWGTTVPSLVAGYAPGCIFVHTDGSGNTYLYFNAGTATSCLFNSLTNYTISDAGSLITSTTIEAALQEAFQHIQSAQHFIPIPLMTLREATNFDVGNAAANGGVLASDTTPVLEGINDATDGCQRVVWAATNTDQVVFQSPLPPNLDVSGNLLIHFRRRMGGTTDTLTLTADSFFNEGDTKVTDTAAGITGTTWAEDTITIAAADVPTGAQTVTVGLTPGAHGNDTFEISALWLEYTGVTLTS